MKKIFKIMLSIILCIACVSFMACGDGEGGDNPQTPTPTTHTITFNLGEYSNAQITATTLTVTEGEEYTLYTPTLEGYTFIKWQRDGVDFANTGTYTLKEDITLTPVFEQDASPQPTTYTITFNLTSYPDAQITATTLTVVDGEEYTLYVPALTGYTFVKWQYNGVDFASTGTYTVKDNITLTPVFEEIEDDGGSDDSGSQMPVTYTITFNLSGYPNAKITATTMTVVGGEEYTLYLPTLTGYTFVGWKYNGVDFANTGTYTLTKNITLTAVFKFDDNWVKEPEIK